MFYIQPIPIGLKKSTFSLNHLILHFSGVIFVTWLIISPIRPEPFTFPFYFLAHLTAKSTKQPGAANPMTSPRGSILFFKVKKSFKIFSINSKRGKITFFPRGTKRMLSTLSAER